jgi:hypothetical protein
VLTNTIYRFKRIGLKPDRCSQWLYSVLAEAAAALAEMNFSGRRRALELNSPNDRTVAVDSAGAARTIKTIEREELANYKAPGRVGIEAFRGCRPECQQNNDYNRAARNHMIRPPADHQGHYSQKTKRSATTFLMKG